jgi:hypothetical protein
MGGGGGARKNHVRQARVLVGRSRVECWVSESSRWICRVSCWLVVLKADGRRHDVDIGKGNKRENRVREKQWEGEASQGGEGGEGGDGGDGGDGL